MGLKVKGMKEAREGFKRAETLFSDAVDDAVREHTKDVFDETQVRVPRKTNALAETGHTSKDDTTRAISIHRIVYGESGEGEGIVDYAAAVHEILDAEHVPPTGPKYVEQPLIESIEKAGHRISKKMNDAKKEVFK